MNRAVYVAWFLAVALGGFATVQLRASDAPLDDAGAAAADAASASLPIVGDVVRPLPREASADPARVALGRRLFHDARLSSDGRISCASCHDLGQGGADHTAYSQGVNGALGDVNAPSVFNAVFNFRQFWDGRAASLDEQVEGPLTNSKEMGSNWNAILAVVGGDPEYAAAFREAYADGVSRATVKNALGTYVGSLVTPDARFDQFLRGERDALSDEERRGWELFQRLGCTNCHQGVNVGGNMFQTMGRMGDYFADRGEVTRADFGRFNVTGREPDRFKFKVPSLRNVALTAPYLHDGRAATLERAVDVMAQYQLGMALDREQVRLLVAFLQTLTGVARERS